MLSLPRVAYVAFVGRRPTPIKQGRRLACRSAGEVAGDLSRLTPVPCPSLFPWLSALPGSPPAGPCSPRAGRTRREMARSFGSALSAVLSASAVISLIIYLFIKRVLRSAWRTANLANGTPMKESIFSSISGAGDGARTRR